MLWLEAVKSDFLTLIFNKLWCSYHRWRRTTRPQRFSRFSRDTGASRSSSKVQIKCLLPPGVLLNFSKIRILEHKAYTCPISYLNNPMVSQHWTLFCPSHAMTSNLPKWFKAKGFKLHSSGCSTYVPKNKNLLCSNLASATDFLCDVSQFSGTL